MFCKLRTVFKEYIYSVLKLSFNRGSLVVCCSLLPLFMLGCRNVKENTAYSPVYHETGGTGTGYAVAADHKKAIEAGMEILSLGGNAADAAVTVSFTLAVVRPEDCGLGGGGFALYRSPEEKEPVVIDFREQAPDAVDLKLYLDRAGKPIPGITTVGAWAVGIPGQVRGALELWKRYKSNHLDLETVLEPAIRFAEEGVPVDRHLNRAMQNLSKIFRLHPEYVDQYYETYTTFLKEGGEPYEEGEVLLRPNLARTLRKIAVEGPDAFYRGDIGMAIVQEIGRFGGPLTLSDLAGYKVRFLKPLYGSFGKYIINSIPPPSSGGAVLLEILNVLNEARIRELNIYKPHLMAEAMKFAFADRGRLLGDRSELVLENVKKMLSLERARAILDSIDPFTVQKVPEEKGAPSSLKGGTSHFCVVDSKGGVVSWTESINLGFGSLITVPGTGIVLNNTLDDFSLTTSGVNAFGLRQSNENLLRAGARPLSSMTPVIVYGPDGLKLVAGASGGPKIISSVLQVVVNVLEEHMSLEKAVRMGRFHQQWVPDILFVEPSLDPEIIKNFLERGHTLRSYSGGQAGCVQAIEVGEGRHLYAVGDPRK